MATKTQFDIFKSVYDEENTRLNELVTRAKVYLSVETFFLGALLFKFDLVLKMTKDAPILSLTFILSAVFFFVALLLTILSLRMLPYEAIFSPKQVINKFGETPPEDSDFLDDRIADLAVATEKNRKQNNRRANDLQWAGICLMIGFGTSIAFLLGAIIIRPISGGG